MEKVHIILTGGTVLTMNEAYDVYPDGAVAIRDDSIVAVGTSADIAARYHADEVIHCEKQIILPGLVNAHTHVPMTLLRGIADDLRLDVWLMGYIMPTEREFVSPEFCRLGTSIACAEMIRSGVTSFCEMYYFEADVAQATADAGMRAVLCESVLKFPAPDAETYDDSIRYAREFIEKWRGHPLITPAIAPHAPYSNTVETMRLCTELALEYDVPLMTHLAETWLEVEDHEKEYGQSVIRWAADIGLFRAKVIAAHCVAIDADEIKLMKKYKVAAAHNPSANLKLASGIAPVNDMLKAGVVVGIGTDGPASNNDLDMFEEMRLAALLAKVPAEDPTALPAKQALTMATRMGAMALRLDRLTGSLEIGKRADIIVMDAQPTHNMPHFTVSPDAVYSRVVYAGKSTDVAHTICNGRVLMRDRQLTTLDEESLKAQAADYALKISSFLIAREGNIVSKLLAISGGVERSESFEVQVKAVLRDIDMIEELLDHPEVKVLKSIHYRQYDTYFMFDDPDMGRVRYREDDNIDEEGEVRSVRSRLTFTMPTKEREYNSAVLLSHSRYISDANRPLRFYREYFQPTQEHQLEKDRRRWHVEYKGVLFFVNVDRVSHPKLPDTYVEIKSRTWSAKDAELKAALIQEMMAILQVKPEDILKDEYLEMREE
jgi:5-methylthioadenosine/S-adenosylhomocysteine deaminase